MKVLHGPNNITGTPKKLADLERSKGLISDSVNTTIIEIDGPAHFNASNNLFSKILFRIKYFYLAITYYEVLNFHAGASLFPLNIDLPILKMFGKKIIIHYYGSEVRMIKKLKEDNPFFDLLKHDGKNSPKQDFIKKSKIFWHSIWANYAVAPRDSFYFISQIYPEKKVIEMWSANILDQDFIALTKEKSIPQKSIPTIIHCPTNRVTKGSSYVEDTIKKLKEKGCKFKYKSIEGMNKSDLQKFIMYKVDIVLDQFLIGTYGNLAIESLALGKVTVGYLNQELCLQFSENCPIVNATLDTLEEKLERLINQRDLRQSIANKGPEYIHEKLEEESIINKLTSLYN